MNIKIGGNSQIVVRCEIENFAAAKFYARAARARLHKRAVDAAAAYLLEYTSEFVHFQSDSTVSTTALHSVFRSASEITNGGIQ